MISIVLYIVILFTFIQPVQAKSDNSSTISISPTIFNISLVPGSLSEYEVLVANNTDSAIPVHMQIEPIFTPDDSIDIPSRGQSIVPWVNMDSNDMIIPARDKRTLSFTIRIPSRVPLGGYYGMIYIQPLLAQKKDANTDVLTKIGVLLLGNVGVQEIPVNKIALNRVSFDSYLYESGDPKIEFTVTNAALNHLSAKPYVLIKPLFGAQFGQDLEEKFVFPGKSRKWNVPIKLNTRYGLIYQTSLFVSIGEGIQKKSTATFVVFPLRTSLFIICILLFSMVIVNKRKNIAKAVRAFFKG